MEGEKVKIAKVLKQIGFSHLLDYFIEEEFTFESFRLLNTEAIREFLPKAGPRLLFWNKYTKYFQDLQNNQNQKKKQKVVYESDSDDPVYDPLIDTNEVLDIDSTVSEEFVKNETEIQDIFYETSIQKSGLSFIIQNETLDPSTFSKSSTPNQKDHSTVTPSDQESSVSRYLSTAQGSILCNKYKRCNTFEDKDRNLLARIIIYKEYEASTEPDQKFRISASRFQKLSEEISKKFPSESPEIYFTPYNSVTRSLCTGKLWNCFNSFKRQLKLSQVTVPEEDCSEDNENPEDVQASLSVLANSDAPWTKVVNSWRITYKHRQDILCASGATVQQYYEKFPVLKSENGYQLLLSDFDVKYKDYSEKFIRKWRTFNKEISKFARSKLGSNECGRVNANTPNELRGFLYLPYLLPNAYMPKNNTLKRIRLSRAEIEKTLITFIQEGNDIMEVIRQDNEKLEEMGIPIHPRIVFVGRSYLKLSEIYIEVNLTLYKIKDALTAIDTYFKVVMALNTTYAGGAKPIWTFIQHYIYELKTERDTSYTSVNVLLTELQSEKSIEGNESHSD